MQSIREIAYKILRNAGGPLHIGKITEEVRRVRDISGKTPKKTINAICQRHKKIERVGPGTFQAIE